MIRFLDWLERLVFRSELEGVFNPALIDELARKYDPSRYPALWSGGKFRTTDHKLDEVRSYTVVERDGYAVFTLILLQNNRLLRDDIEVELDEPILAIDSVEGYGLILTKNTVHLYGSDLAHEVIPLQHQPIDVIGLGCKTTFIVLTTDGLIFYERRPALAFYRDYDDYAAFKEALFDGGGLAEERLYSAGLRSALWTRGQVLNKTRRKPRPAVDKHLTKFMARFAY